MSKYIIGFIVIGFIVVIAAFPSAVLSMEEVNATLTLCPDAGKYLGKADLPDTSPDYIQNLHATISGKKFHATSAEMIQGHADAYIGMSIAAGTGKVLVASILNMGPEGDKENLFAVESLYTVSGVLDADGGGQGNGGGAITSMKEWEADYNKGEPRILLEVNESGDDDNIIAKGLNSATLFVTIVPPANPASSYEIDLSHTTGLGEGTLTFNTPNDKVTISEVDGQWETVAVRLTGGDSSGETTIEGTCTGVEKGQCIVDVVNATKIKLGQTSSESSTYTGREYYCTYIPTKWGGTFTPGPTLGKATTINGGNTVGWCLFEISGTGDASYKVATWFVQQHSLTKTPWNSWWWPQDTLHVGPHMYDDPGPLSLYDDCYTLTGDASALEWEKTWRKCSHSPSCDYGYCDSVTMAGFEEEWPVSKSKNGVQFLVSDCLGLMVSRWAYSVTWGPNWKFIKTTAENTLTAKWFHNAIRTQIAENAGGITLWWGLAYNWNPGMYKYRAYFIAEGIDSGNEKKINVKLTMWHKNWSTTSSPIAKGETSDEDMRYSIKFANDGTVDSTIDWPATPDKKPQRAMWHNQNGIPMNSKTTVAKLEAIYR